MGGISLHFCPRRHMPNLAAARIPHSGPTASSWSGGPGGRRGGGPRGTALQATEGRLVARLDALDLAAAGLTEGVRDRARHAAVPTPPPEGGPGRPICNGSLWQQSNHRSRCRVRIPRASTMVYCARTSSQRLFATHTSGTVIAVVIAVSMTYLRSDLIVTYFRSDHNGPADRRGRRRAAHDGEAGPARGSAGGGRQGRPGGRIRTPSPTLFGPSWD